MTTFQGTNTYLLECSRENSRINQDDNESTNGSWSNETSMVIKRGDRISVEMVCANIRGSGTGAPTIEFSGQNIVENGVQKPYCDTKVLIEVFFTQNNNNTYSVGLPLIHPNGGINGPQYNAGTTPPSIAGFPNLVMPFNLNPRVPSGQITNQVNNYREINESIGYVKAGNLVAPGPGTPIVPTVDVHSSYSIYQYRVSGAWLAAGVACPSGTGDPRVEAIRVVPHAASQTAQSTSNPLQPPYPLPTGDIPWGYPPLCTDVDNGILKGRTGNSFQNNFYVGNHIFVSDMAYGGTYITTGCWWLGEISEINGSPIGLGTPAMGISLVELYFNNDNAYPSAKYPNWDKTTSGGTGLPAGAADYIGGARFNCYVGDVLTTIPTAGAMLCAFNYKAGSSQEGLINYDNLNMNNIVLNSPAIGTTARTILGNGYQRGNNSHFLYARNTRKLQKGQTPNLSLFPGTIFNPVASGATEFNTSTAGIYGPGDAGKMDGYRNANVCQENNNDPYIYMRNDHFGCGRIGMNGEKMPRAEPMTAFIYVTIEELLQDVNSLTAVINERLQETLTGMNTNTRQSSDLLVNSLMNPDGRQPASNVVPYYNKIGFYDKDVTEGTVTTPPTKQNDLMKLADNAQFRNEITNIIPVKNGGTVKINPANGTSGRDKLACNFGKQYGGIPQLELGTSYDASPALPLIGSITPFIQQLEMVKRNTYLREIETTFEGDSGGMILQGVNNQGWANPFYGNMATADLYSYQLGDRISRLPLNKLNTLETDPFTRVDPTSGATVPFVMIRDVGKPIIMNTQFTYNILNFNYPAGASGYLGQLGTSFPSAVPSQLNSTRLYENQLIYTNIVFPGSFVSETINGTVFTKFVSEDNEDGDWAALAYQMRKYETYFNITAGASAKYENQKRDVKNWIYNGDIGQTDDRSTAQLRTVRGQPRADPPGVYPDTDTFGPPGATAWYTGNRALHYDWMATPEQNALGASPSASALGVSETNFLEKNVNRTVLCPSMSHEIFAGISAGKNIDYEEKFRMLKQLGRIKLKSRFNKDFFKDSVNFAGLPLGVPLAGGDVHDAEFLKTNSPSNPVPIPTDFMAKLDLPFYPYIVKQYNLNGVLEDVVLCAISVGCDYNANEYELPTINIGCLVWGNQIGISTSFFDNHAIIPMNNDLVKRTAKLTTTITTPSKWDKFAYSNANFMEVVPNPPTTAGSYPLTTGVLLFPLPALGPSPPAPKNSNWDFTFDYLQPPYINAAGRVRYRITYAINIGPENGPGTITGEWEQNTNLASVSQPGDYVFIKGDADFTLGPSWSPKSVPFAGFMLNPNTNTTSEPWLLTTATANRTSGGFPCWRAMMNLSNAPGALPAPNEPSVLLDYYDWQPGGYHAYPGNFTAVQYRQVTIEVLELAQTTSAGDGVPINLGLEQNKVNYIWNGATKPTFQYDQTKGRVEFIQLQDDNILNVRSIPYAEGTQAQTSGGSVGTKAGIINSASEDAVYSRDTLEEDFSLQDKVSPVKNAGVRAEISSVGIYNIWLCPESYEPPPTINLSSYWSNKVNPNDTSPGAYWSDTEAKRQEIIKGCVEASDENWSGSLFARLGFQTHRELMPIYGKQSNRFNPYTYNTTKPALISRATKPLILCNSIDNSIMPALNTFFSPLPTTTPPAAKDIINGMPMYSQGFLNNESVAIDLQNQALTATSPPILSTSPFLLIESDICQTNWRSGRTQQNVLFYLMKNYQASSFIYGYGSSYTHTANQDRVISMINTAFRDPITGRLQKCSKNSTIIYKIERDIVIPPPLTDVEGVPLNIKPPISETDKLLQRIANQGSNSGVMGNTGMGGKASQSISVPESETSGIQNSLLRAPEPQIADVERVTQIATGTQTNQTILDNAFKYISDIAPRLGINEGEADIMAYAVQQIMATFPIQLVYHNGGVKPMALVGIEGESQNMLLGQMSSDIIQYTINTITNMGGLPDMMKAFQLGGSSGLLRLIERNTLHPETGAPVQLGGNVSVPQDIEGLASLNVPGVGSAGLGAISNLMVSYFSDNPRSSRMAIQNGMVGQLKGTIQTEDRAFLSDPLSRYESHPTTNFGTGDVDLSTYFSENEINRLPRMTEGGREEKKTEPDERETGETKESSMSRESTRSPSTRPPRAPSRGSTPDRRTRTPTTTSTPPKPPEGYQGGTKPTTRAPGSEARGQPSEDRTPSKK